MGGQIAQLGLTFITSMIIARMLSSDGYGLVNLLRTIFATLALVAPLGLDAALLKHAGRTDPNDAKLKAAVLRLRLLTATIGFSLAIGVPLLGRDVIDKLYPYENFHSLLIVALLALPFAADIAILGAIYRARGQAALFAILNQYFQAALRLLMVGAAVFLSPTVGTMVTINTLQVVFSASALFLHNRLTQRRIEPTQPAVSSREAWKEARGILKESAWMCLALFVYSMMRLVDVLFLGAYADARSVGEYTALATIAQLIQFYPLAASQSLGPNISRLHHAGDADGVRRQLVSYMRFASLVAGFMFAGIAIFGTRLDLLFGPSFHFRPEVCFLLPLGHLLSAVLAPTGYSLSMTGRHRQEYYILAGGFVFLLCLCSVFVPRYGQVGAAGSVAAAFALVNIVRFAYVSKVLGFVPGALRDVLPALLGVVVALGARELGDLVGSRNLITMILSCIAYTLVFGALVYAFLLNPIERSRTLAAFGLAGRHRG